MGFVVDFFKPKKKDPPAVVPPVGAPGNVPSAAGAVGDQPANVRDEVERNRRRRTRTILTGPQGATLGSSGVAKTLLGG